MTERPWHRTARRLALAGGLAATMALLLVATAAAGSSVSVSGSAYVDDWNVGTAKAARHAPSGVSIEGALKMSVDVNDDVAFAAKACFSCHGLELESIAFEYMPSNAFNVQAGRISVPFGEYHARVDQSGHKTASAPLIYDMGRAAYFEKGAMNMGVLPMPYVDTGVLVYGQRFLGPVQAWYGIYGVGGLRGGNDIDWTSMRSLYYTDTNRDPAGGARVSFTYAAGTGGFIKNSSVGASFTAGSYDRDSKLKYLVWGADAVVGLGPVTLRAEYAWRRTDLSPTANYAFQVVDPWVRKDGWYVEAEGPFTERLSGVVRLDELRRTGVLLPGATAGMAQDSEILRTSAGLVYTPAQSIFVKLGYEYWSPSDFSSFHSVHLGFGGAY